MFSFLKKLLPKYKAWLYLGAAFFKVVSLLFEFITIFTIIPVFQGNDFSYSLYFLPTFLKNIINDSLNNIQPESALYFFLIIGVGYSLTRLFGNLMTNELYKFLIKDLRDEVFERITNIKMVKSSFIDPSHLNHLVTVDAKNIARSVITTIEFYPIIFMILSSIFFTLKFSLYIMCAVIVFFLIILIIYVLFSNKIEKHSHITYDHSVSLNKMSKNFFYNLKFFKVNNYLDYFLNKIKKESKLNYESFFVVERSRDIISFSYETLGIVFIYVFFTLVLEMDKNLSNAIFIIILFYRISPGIVNLQSKMISIRLGMAAYANHEKVRESLDELIQDKNETKQIDKKQINFNRGEFSIPNRQDRFIFLDEFTLYSNKNYLIKGASGAGKSTLIEFLLGGVMYDGIVSVDGFDITTLSDSNFDELFSYVSDKVELVDGSLRENICFGNNVSEEELSNVIQASGFDGVLSEKQIDLNYVINPFNLNFSSGELQRLSISRALIKKCSYFIFDEAMNNLDVHSEKKILQNIKQLFSDTALIYISHRSGLESYFDHIINVENGRFSFE